MICHWKAVKNFPPKKSCRADRIFYLKSSDYLGGGCGILLPDVVGGDCVILLLLPNSGGGGGGICVNLLLLRCEVLFLQDIDGG